MILSRMTWQEVDKLSRDVVVLIPTGSLEQHGPHLPLFTDTLLVTYVAERVEGELADLLLMTPPVWMGASGHHLKMSGTISAKSDTYIGSIRDIIASLSVHGFWKFFILNGHGGNTDLNSLALRQIKEEQPNLMLGHSGYFAFSADVVAATLEGPLKEIRHACEAEASMMMAAYPDLVRNDKLRDDGLYAEPPVTGMVHFFDEMTEEGSFGYATLATPEKGTKLLSAAIAGATKNLRAVAEGYQLIERPRD